MIADVELASLVGSPKWEGAVSVLRSKPSEITLSVGAPTFSPARAGAELKRIGTSAALVVSR